MIETVYRLATPDSLGWSGALIRNIGRSQFESSLLDALSQTVAAEHATIFLITRTGNLLHWGAASLQGRPSALNTTRRFLASIWRNNSLSLGVEMVARAGITVFRRRSSEIRDSDYRTLCYDRPGIIDRLSVSVRHGGMLTLVNAYRSQATGPFSFGDVRAMREQADVLAAAAGRHMELHTCQTADVMDFPNPALSRREQQVYDLIVAGHTSRQIAGDLGLTLQTVLTYRKRLYEKLGVSSQQALLVQRFSMRGPAV